MTTTLTTQASATDGALAPVGAAGSTTGAHPDPTGPRRTGFEAHTPSAALLSVRDLTIGFEHMDGPLVRGVSFDLHRGRCVALVGESGSGKSLTARTLVGLTGPGAQVAAECLVLGEGRSAVPGADDPGADDPGTSGLGADSGTLDLLRLTPRDWRRVRGGRIGFVLQDALVSLDPLRRVGAEIDEALRVHTGLSRRARKEEVHRLLADAGVPEPRLRARERPAQLSGGLRQRALIASALAAGPEVLIADEPTTALDATVQAQVLELLAQRRAAGQSLILISHDLAVVAELADEVLVMRAGEVVEQGSPEQILSTPSHPYTRALIQAVPGPHTRGRRLAGEGGGEVPREAAPDAHESAGASASVLEVRGARKSFRPPGGERRVAVDDVSFVLGRSEVLGIVGESGSGKSTTGRIVLGLEDLDGGHVRLLGENWSSAPEARRRVLRHRLSVVWQDPLSSFDPRWPVRRILDDAIRAATRADDRSGTPQPDAGAESTVEQLLESVGLAPAIAERDPRTLSGGQRQRVAIARALAASPDVLVLDEAVSALDVSIQAQILDLVHDLCARRGLSCLFISHDLGVIAHLSDRVLVMKDGAVVEEGHPQSIFEDPQHPYTRTLVDSALGLVSTTAARTPAHTHPPTGTLTEA
ncbi:dipeptide ABC transporter ATP-binding protein [Brevibacterium jeotgali]|uniref:Peptide/nickel transport system ATP-binding protein n=1 Tax=Brevibacterium jeotgali TaxID=1262550 RepID=A0A2H1L5Y9_9MICO|nr:ABC transporter ATP-binding protein [Brevibacterium jeotgali]TWB98853.1 peptide/nickel transport system ATP-binding protein [Brevibacterium jeotgali]SMY12317.1 peptide/nickel transport system ATP-binding protein [Brevibacterium jeotgali]